MGRWMIDGVNPAGELIMVYDQATAKNDEGNLHAAMADE